MSNVANGNIILALLLLNLSSCITRNIIHLLVTKIFLLYSYLYSLTRMIAWTIFYFHCSLEYFWRYRHLIFCIEVKNNTLFTSIFMTHLCAFRVILNPIILVIVKPSLNLLLEEKKQMLSFLKNEAISSFFSVYWGINTHQTRGGRWLSVHKMVLRALLMSEAIIAFWPIYDVYSCLNTLMFLSCLCSFLL
jgi:hypothetical protein